MDESKKAKLGQYISSVRELFKQVDSWLKEKNLKTKRENTQIHEEASGPYTAPMLKIFDPNSQCIAELRPIGTWIIAAKGRIDLIGKLDKTTLVELDKGGPHITTSIAVGDQAEKPISKPLYKGIDASGWYWIEDKLRGKAHLINKDLFLELLAEVSDYE